MKLSENLKIIRRENNLSQEQLAEQLGVSRQAVSKWESDQSYPEMDKVLLICKLYGYGIDELMNENVSVVKEERQSRNNINKYIDDFFSFITKTVEMFCSMKFKQKIKCLIEQGCIALFLVCIFAILGAVGGQVFAGIFGKMPWEAYEVYIGIVRAVYIVLAFAIGLSVLLHIFKIRYLDYYEIVREGDITDNAENNSKKQSDNINSEENGNAGSKEEENNSKKKTIFIKDKREKIIIREPEHTQSKFLTGIIKIVLTCFKALAVLVGIEFSLFFIMLVTLTILSFLFVKAGLVFIGALFVLIAGLFLNFIILKILYYFIISKKNNKKTIGIIIISSLALIGIGTILGGLTQFEYIDANKKIDEYTVEMTDKLMIESSFYDVEYIENNSDSITIRFEGPEFSITNCYMQKSEKFDYNRIRFNWYNDSAKTMESIKSFINDINNKKLRNHDRTKIYVVTSKENHEKLKQNKIEYDKEIEENIKNLNNNMYGTSSYGSSHAGPLLLEYNLKWEDQYEINPKN